MRELSQVNPRKFEQPENLERAMLAVGSRLGGKLIDLQTISFNLGSKADTKGSPVTERSELKYYNPPILFITPEQQRKGSDTPETLRSLILRFERCVYPSAIIPIELKVRVPFQPGISPQ
jgi:hypothetical protein